MPTSHPRRHFLGRAAAAIAALTTGIPGIAAAESLGVDGLSDEKNDDWMKALKGKHKQVFHATASNDLAMLMASNFLDAYKESYGAKDGEANAVVGIHGPALVMGLNDAAWAKYAIGKSSSITDPATKEPSLRNIFATGTPLGISSLQQRGVVFIMCNTALRMRSRAVAAERGESYETVYADLSASRLPGVILVPALVVALNRAQEAGFTYVRA